MFFLYKDAMFNICLRMLKHQQEAEDILQNSFIDVFKNLNRFNGESTIGAWIKRIVINNCLNRLKKKRIHFSDIEYANQAPIETDIEFEPNSLTVQNIQKAIHKLPSGYKIILNLYLFEGYDHKEIASILEITESTSKSQYSRAKKKLRKLLLDESPKQGGLLIAL